MYLAIPYPRQCHLVLVRFSGDTLLSTGMRGYLSSINPPHKLSMALSDSGSLSPSGISSNPLSVSSSAAITPDRIYELDGSSKVRQMRRKEVAVAVAKPEPKDEEKIREEEKERIRREEVAPLEARLKALEEMMIRLSAGRAA